MEMAKKKWRTTECELNYDLEYEGVSEGYFLVYCETDKFK